MSKFGENMKTRTKQFALDCWLICNKIPNERGYNAYVRQLIRCSSSVGANYRSAQRAKSSADFINKLKIVEEETDESMYFLELLLKVADKVIFNDLKKLHMEANEILSIVVSSINTARKNRT